MLTEEQKALIRAEEEFRERVRAEFTTTHRAPSFWQKLLDFLNSNVGGWLLGTVVVGLAGVTWTMVYEYVHREDRRIAQIRADAQKDADMVTKLLPHLANVEKPESRLALKLLLHLRDANGINPALADALNPVFEDVVEKNIRAAESTTDESKRATYQASAEVAVAALDAHPPVRADPASPLPQRIYVHIGGEAQRNLAQRIQTHFRQKNFLMPGIENVGQKAPNIADVRYFNDVDEVAAKQVALELANLGVSAAPKRIDLKAPVAQLEIWLAKPGN